MSETGTAITPAPLLSSDTTAIIAVVLGTVGILLGGTALVGVPSGPPTDR